MTLTRRSFSSGDVPGDVPERIERKLYWRQMQIAWWQQMRPEKVARLKAGWLPSAPRAALGRDPAPRERGGVGLEEERERYASLDPDGRFFQRAMGLDEEKEEEDGIPGDWMDLP